MPSTDNIKHALPQLSFEHPFWQKLSDEDVLAIEAGLEKLPPAQRALLRSWWTIAFLAGKLELMESALAMDLPLDSLDKNGATLLHYAAWSGNAEAVFALVNKYNFAPKSVDTNGRTLLHYAAWSGNAEAVIALVDKYELDPKAVDTNGATLLHYAAQSGNAEAVIALVDRCNLDPKVVDKNGATLLHYAAQSGNAQAVIALVDKYELDPKAVTKYGESLLHYAAQSGNAQAVIALVDKYELDPKAVTKYGESLLHYAAWSGNAEAVFTLKNSYPHLSWMKKDRGFLGRVAYNILHALAQSGSLRGIKAFIFQAPALAKQFNIQDINGDMPDVYAARAGLARGVSRAIDELIKEATVAFLNGKNTGEHLTLLSTFQVEFNAWLVGQVREGFSITGVVDKKMLAPLLKSETLQLAQYFAQADIVTPFEAEEPLTWGQLNAVATCLMTIASEQSSEQAKAFAKLLQRLHSRANVLGETSLSPQSAATLRLLLDLYYQTPDTSSYAPVYAYLAQSLESSETVQKLRPKGKISKSEYDFSEAGYKSHFKTIYAFINSSTMAEDAKRSSRNFIKSLEHIIFEKGLIASFLRVPDREKLYETPQGIPLHTDAVPSTEEAIRTYLDETLREAVQSTLAGFYQARAAGTANIYFDKLTSTYCFENRTRDALTWLVVSGSSEAKPFAELMQETQDDYKRYRLLLDGVSPDYSLELTPVSDFLFKRLQHVACLADETYAPAGNVTKKSIKSFLIEILWLDDAPPYIGQKSEELAATQDKTNTEKANTLLERLKQADTLLELEALSAEAKFFFAEKSPALYGDFVQLIVRRKHAFFEEQDKLMHFEHVVTQEEVAVSSTAFLQGKSLPVVCLMCEEEETLKVLRVFAEGQSYAVTTKEQLAWARLQEFQNQYQSLREPTTSSAALLTGWKCLLHQKGLALCRRIDEEMARTQAGSSSRHEAVYQLANAVDVHIRHNAEQNRPLSLSARLKPQH